MYLDNSLIKIVALGSIVVLLTVLVYATHIGKMNTFGSTPYFYAIATGTRYVLQSLAASFETTAGRMLASISAFRSPNATTTAQKASQKNARGIPILTYHRIVEDASDENNVTTERFRDQMQTLHDAGWKAITLEDFEAYIAGSRELPEKSFLITFDDGAKQSFYPVDPILKLLDYHAAIFIIVASSHTPESTYYLSPEEIALLLRTGRWSIGSHSYDGHRPYATSKDGTTGIYFADRLFNHEAQRLETPEEFTARVREDLRRSREELERTYNVPIRTFAFPLGNETGILGANNFPEGALITDAEARNIYDIGFLQTNYQDYTFNFPKDSSALSLYATTSKELSTNFQAYRIHVDYDWDGERLRTLMENGLAKELPYEDNFSANNGWISAWGDFEIGRNNLRISAEPNITSASIFLDGSALWDNYSYEVAAEWDRGYALVLVDVVHSKSYRSCAFFDGGVRIQRTINGETHTLKEYKNPAITYSTSTRMGARVHGSVIECTWNFTSVVEDYSRDFSGGIGLQTWHPDSGVASLQATSLIVRPYESVSTQ